MTEKESLHIIHDMIQQARANLRDDGFFYLLWGWAVLIGAVVHYLLLALTTFMHPYLVWPVLILGAMIITLVVFRKRHGQATNKTHLERLIGQVWLGMGAAIFFVIALGILGKMTFTQVYPILIMLYGLATFAAGAVLKYRPLMIGGAICWPLALVASFFAFDLQLLVLALSIVISFLIPGYLLRKSVKGR